MGLKPELLRGISTYGLERPSTFEGQVITPLLKGNSVIAQAPSVIGKTATLPIFVLQKLDSDMSIKDTQALILVPSRESAHQVSKVVIALGHYMNVECHTCVGATNLREDMARLREGVQIVVGTPGRVLDMINRRALKTERIKTFCLDEVDEMLSRGFKEQIEEIFLQLPRDPQVAFFTCTMPGEITEVAKGLMRDPVVIRVERDELSLEHIKQFYVTAEEEEKKLETLYDLCGTEAISQAIIFGNSRRRVEWLVEKLSDQEISGVSAMHGDMDAAQRKNLMKTFNADTNSFRFLVTTDLPTRSLEVTGGRVMLIINFDVPTSRDEYFQRIGWFGRFGRRAVTINLTTVEEMSTLRDVEEMSGKKIDELPSNYADVI